MLFWIERWYTLKGPVYFTFVTMPDYFDQSDFSRKMLGRWMTDLSGNYSYLTPTFTFNDNINKMELGVATQVRDVLKQYFSIANGFNTPEDIKLMQELESAFKTGNFTPELIKQMDNRLYVPTNVVW